jgi:hypothetical protein
MVQIARDHHFVAQCYLAGFTDTGTKEGRLCVYDFKAERFFRQKPRNVAYEMDFNRVDVEGHAPDALETAFGEFEGRTASVIRRIVTEHDIPEDEEFSYVLNMIALLAVRNPSTRRSMTVSQRHAYRVIGDMLASDRNLYESQLRQAQANGFVAADKEVPFERMRDFLRKDDYTIEIPPEAHLQRELAVFQNILEQVSARNWSLLKAAADAPDFITCDHPVSLVYKQLLFPLDARHALMGDREQGAPRVMTLKAAGVAEVNTRMQKLADRQIYSRTPEVAFFDGEDAVTVPMAELARQGAAQK